MDVLRLPSGATLSVLRRDGVASSMPGRDTLAQSSAAHQAWHPVPFFGCVEKTKGGGHGVLKVTCSGSKRKKSSPGSPSTTERAGTSGGGFGSKPAAKPSFDAGVLLRRSELLYSQLLVENALEGDLREFVVCVREKGTATRKSILDDWLPVAELALISQQDAAEALPVLLPTVCREVAECAAKAAVALRSVSRSDLEYAYEPADAFYEHVMSGSNVKLSSSECPYSVLGLSKGASATQVRAAYRTLASKFHPDKHYGAESSDADAQFKRVTGAYEQIKRAGLAAEGGVGGYASLGGTARTGLSEPVTITSRNLNASIPPGVRIAVRQLDPEVVTPFLTRLYAPSGRPSRV